MNDMTSIVEIALQNASVGQLAMALQSKLTRNVEVKIKPTWVRVQHTMHCDKLASAQQIDEALSRNFS